MNGKNNRRINERYAGGGGRSRARRLRPPTIEPFSDGCGRNDNQRPIVLSCRGRRSSAPLLVTSGRPPPKRERRRKRSKKTHLTMAGNEKQDDSVRG